MTDHDPDAKPLRTMDDLGDGVEDGLVPLRSLDVAGAGSFSELLAGMRQTSFGGRQLGEAVEVLVEMVRDPDCLVVGTFSGAMTMAKMGLLITEMIERGMLQAVIATGALISHGFIEESGHAHYKHDPSLRDDELFHRGYNRVYDTIELEQSLDTCGWTVCDVLDDMPRDRPYASWELCRALGAHLAKHPGRGMLQAARAMDVPVYIPAFTDSEMGLVAYEYNLEVAETRGKTPVPYDAFADLDHYRRKVAGAKRLGIFTIGGGVPRNWAQQVGPLVDAMQRRISGACTDPCRFRYAVRVCPEPVHWGGLSGCTYSEGVSWGKFLPPTEGGRYAEVFSDATIAWPFLLKAAMERLA